MNSGKILLGVLAGAAVGATLGMLFTPKRGKTMCKRILQKKDHYVEAIEEKFDDLLDGIKEKTDTILEKAGRVAENAKSKV
jgi:gas vesicle protein